MKKYVKASESDRDSVLCGFVWCHGPKDFDVWETDAISPEDQAKIESILAKYDTTGSSVRSAWGSNFNELFVDSY